MLVYLETTIRMDGTREMGPAISAKLQAKSAFVIYEYLHARSEKDGDGQMSHQKGRRDTTRST